MSATGPTQQVPGHGMTNPEPNTDPNPAPQPDPQEQPTQGGGDAPKTFTEAELNAMVASRLSKQEKAFERRLADELKKAEERAKLGDAERLQAERDELTKKLEALEAEKSEALLRAQLAKDVTDLDYAIFKVRQSDGKYVAKDGSIDTAALLKDHPTLKAQPDPKPGPAPTTAGGGAAKGADMNAAIRRAAGRT